MEYHFAKPQEVVTICKTMVIVVPYRTMRGDDLVRAYRQITPDSEPCEAFLRAAHLQDFTEMAHFGLVLIAPECFAVGTACALADKMHELGLIPLDVELIDRLGDEAISAMFVPGWIPSRYRFWLVQRRFRIGATAAVLVTHVGSRPIAEVLASAKGDRIPRLAAVSTWRGDLPSVNGVLNLVHTADGPEYVVRNGIPFFTAQRLASAFHSARQIRNGRPAELTWARIRQNVLLAYDCQTRVCPSFFSAYFTLLARILSLEWLSRKCSKVESAQQATARALSESDLKSGSLPTRRDAIRAVADLYSERTRIGTPREKLATALISLDLAASVDWDTKLQQLLNPVGVWLDPWHSLVLMATLYYADEGARSGTLGELSLRE